ncbi:DUF4157 domain-containing protein [Marinomonas agarivorans]|nr:DUF4157 domain-containing protein [Marinomonas agarivorans]
MRPQMETRQYLLFTQIKAAQARNRHHPLQTKEQSQAIPETKETKDTHCSTHHSVMQNVTRNNVTRNKEAKNRRAKNKLAKTIKSLPACLQRGMEKLTGVNLQKVRVHYNSDKPAQVQAHAYAQGQNIYLAPGQEHHLPHELGHIVQQALNMVQPTKVVNGVAINDDPKLEHHATELGNRAMKLGC